MRSDYIADYGHEQVLASSRNDHELNQSPDRNSTSRLEDDSCTFCSGSGGAPGQIDHEYDAIVVGSGYGGAVAACRLAQAGLKVCILEKGRRWEAPNFPESLWQTMRETTFNTPLGTFGIKSSLYQVHVDSDCLALVGSGLGGGSLMSAGVWVRTPRRTRKDPRWPQEWEKNWSTYESLSQAMLEPEYVPHCFPKKEVMEVIKDEIEDVQPQENSNQMKINVRFKDVINVAGVKQSACVACGNCIMGCNYNAKSSTDKNYIAAAVQAGAHVRTESKVIFIAENTEEVAAACKGGACACASWHCSRANSEGNEAHSSGSAVPGPGGRRWRVYMNDVSYLSADIVILGGDSLLKADFASDKPKTYFGRNALWAPQPTKNAFKYKNKTPINLRTKAGVFGTNEILLRSRERGLRLSERLGKGVSCNGNNIGFVSGSPAPLKGQGIDRSAFAATPKPHRPGPTICNSYTSSAGYTIQAGTFPKNLPYLFIRLWTFGSGKDRSSHIPKYAKAIWAQMKVWARTRFSSFMLLNMMGYDESDGEITLDKTTGRIRFVAPHDSNMAKKISACQRLAKRIQAQLYVCRFRSAAAHLLGGCGAAHDPRHGVANPDGQVFYLDLNPKASVGCGDGTLIDSDHEPRGSFDVHPGLFVCDGSLIPCAVGVNPSATITIVAEKVAAAAVQYAAESLVKEIDRDVKASTNCSGDCDGLGRNRVHHSGRGEKAIQRSNLRLLMPWENGTILSPQPSLGNPSPKVCMKPAPVVVRETLRGQVAGLPCELNIVMHMGVDAHESIHSRRFGDPHRLLRGRVGGTMRVPLLNKEVLHIIDGSVDMCWIDNRTPFTQYMHCHLLFGSATGARYVFKGKKEMHPYLGLAFAWAESTTLLVKIQQVAPQKESFDLHTSEVLIATSHAPDAQKQHPKIYPVLEGALTVSLFELLKSLISLEGSGRLSFARLLTETLTRTYILRNPRVLDQPKHSVIGLQNSKSKAPVRVLPHTLRESYVGHVLHEFTTDDGVRISARQWVCPEKAEKPTSSNVVLLLNGHSTESFWLPTEPTDVVRTLLQSGYEPWLFNPRLHPLHTIDRQFNLDHLAKYDIPAVVRQIEHVRGDGLPIHVVAHCVGGLNIHMAILGGHVHISKIASILCTNSSMFFQVTKLAMAKLILPLMPISMAILGKNTVLRTNSNSEDSLRHQLLRFTARQVPRKECCTDESCNTFSGVFGNTFWHGNVTHSVHSNYMTPDIFPMSAMPHLRRIILKGHLVDAAGQESYLTNPEKLAVPTTYISGGKELLVTQRTGRSAVEFMTKHHPQFVHTHKIVPDYGHSDLLTGETSSSHVYPLILQHLSRVRTGQHFSKENLKGTRRLKEWEQETSGNSPFSKHLVLGIFFFLLLVIVMYITRQ